MRTGENEFELSVGRPAGDVRPSLRQVRGAIRRAAKAGAGRPKTLARSTVRAHFAKGTAKRARPVKAAMRRVVVKARFVSHVQGRAATLRAHVSYLARDGAARPEGTARDLGNAPEDRPAHQVESAVGYLGRDRAGGGQVFYDQTHVSLDARGITASWHGDQRHFRLIISAEDGAELGELRPFVRETLARLERHVGTRLEWVAVDHWDTDNPHTHVLVRGVRDNGKDLVIPGKVLSVFIREDAQEIATRILGPRPALAIQREREQEIAQRGLTRLDRELMAMDGPGGLGNTFRHTDLAARLDQLERWELASRDRDGSWRLASDLPAQLKRMSEAVEVQRVVDRQMRDRSHGPILAAGGGEQGALVALSNAHDGGDDLIAIIETGRGELRYARFHEPGALAMLEETPAGALVAFEPREARVGPADEAVMRVARMSRGLYSADIHARLESGVEGGLIDANVRRLEAMRRQGLITRGNDGIFTIPPDHFDRVMTYERARIARSPLFPAIQSYLTLPQQVKANGPTQLDRVLAGEAPAVEGMGALAREFEVALRQRRMFLIEAGWLGASDTTLSPRALEKMAVHELQATAKQLSQEMGMPVTLAAGDVSGTYARRLDLAQGRVALIVGEGGSQLVPWRPALERFAGRSVLGVVRGRSLSWSLQRAPSVDLPPM